jgi:ribosomal protein S18 acetylase RimI-like enzyme
VAKNMPMNVRIVGLNRQHDRSVFDCGESELNGYLQRLARQQAQRDFSRTYVAELPAEHAESAESGVSGVRIGGFYSISSGSIDFMNLPPALKLPRYPVPVARMGRLAVDARQQGHGVGGALMAHAMHLVASLAEQIGLYALVVNAKHEAAAAYYLRYGFQRFADQHLSLFLTTDVIRKALVIRAVH